MNTRAKNENLATIEERGMAIIQAKSEPVLVTGATGKQGGAVARALLAIESERSYARHHA